VPGKADTIDRRYHGSFVALAEIQSPVALLDATAADTGYGPSQRSRKLKRSRVGGCSICSQQLLFVAIR
jgi:hypothetical protein